MVRCHVSTAFRVDLSGQSSLLLNPRMYLIYIFMCEFLRTPLILWGRGGERNEKGDREDRLWVFQRLDLLNAHPAYTCPHSSPLSPRFERGVLLLSLAFPRLGANESSSLQYGGYITLSRSPCGFERDPWRLHAVKLQAHTRQHLCLWTHMSSAPASLS